MGPEYEDKDGNEISREEAIEQLTNDYIECDEDNHFSREEHEDYATYVVDSSEDGAIWWYKEAILKVVLILR